MQPRITPTLPTRGSVLSISRIYSGPAGIDPYAFAVSDVYQDLFKEGSYVGKGIYDIDAFEAVARGARSGKHACSAMISSKASMRGRRS